MKCNEMVDTIGFVIICTGKMLIKNINSAFATLNLEITFEQMGVLYFLSKNEGKELIQQDIANLLNKTKSAALRTINILEEKKYLKRTSSPEDMRKNIIELTPEGRRIIVKMHKKFLELDLNLNKSITKQEANVCKKVLLNIQEKCN
ncbi:MAG TPA: MarR family transcriptional regulator [Hanamia sp.]|nr:MarR family transcriptional regulator [Hanamia sp.]